MLFRLLWPKQPWSVNAWTPLGPWRCAVAPGTKINVDLSFPSWTFPKASHCLCQLAFFPPRSAPRVSVADGHVPIVSAFDSATGVTPCNNATHRNAWFISALFQTYVQLLKCWAGSHSLRSPHASLVLPRTIFDEDHKHSTRAREMHLLLLTYQLSGQDANIHIVSWWRDNQGYSHHLSAVIC